MMQKLKGWNWLEHIRVRYCVTIPGWLMRLLPYKYVHTPGARWDTEYSSGHWDFLRQRKEFARYSIIAGYHHCFKPGGSILDIGCGDGILNERLVPQLYSYYLGIDLSEQAIDRAKALCGDSNNEFLVANMEQYGPDRSFDVIVFNECLYYVGDPVGIVQKYEGYLEDQGIIIISMYDMVIAHKIWTMLEDVYSYGVQCRLNDGGTWTIRIYDTSKVS
jgi:2-polyprenyl-3-methyl-5-hydroxy-6-metoxy-1,4-benzoquinol methylase